MDDELIALCRQYPGFVRFATLMENLSETMRTGVGVPAHIKEMAPLPEALGQAMIKLMSDGAELERGLQQRIEAGRPRRQQKAKVPEGPPPNRGDLDDLYQQWSAEWLQNLSLQTTNLTSNTVSELSFCHSKRRSRPISAANPGSTLRPENLAEIAPMPSASV